MIKDRFANLKRCGGLFVAVALLIIMALPLSVAAADPVVSIPDASAQNCNTVQVELRIDGVTNLAAAEIWLHYDTSVVVVDSAVAGDIALTFPPIIDNVVGVTKLVFFKVTPPYYDGDLVYGYITFHAVGSAGETSLLDIDVKNLTNGSLLEITHSVSEGTFTVSGAPTAPDISVDPTSKNFGSVNLGLSSTQMFTVSNDGTADLLVGTATITDGDAGEFAIVYDDVSGATIAPATSERLDVEFSPTSTGMKTAELRIPSNDTDEDPLIVELRGRGTTEAPPVGVRTQVAFLLDSSGSISLSEWVLMVEGLADAVKDSDCFPHNGSVELTVVRFGDSADVPVGPVVITAGNADSVAADIAAIPWLAEFTCISCAFDAAAGALKGSPNFDPSLKQAINLVTDGNPEPESKEDAEDGRDDCIDDLDMTSRQDVICCEAIGSGADVEWLRDEIAFPQPGCDWPIGDSEPDCDGWVRQVEDAEEFADTICEKLEAILIAPPECGFTAAPTTGMAPLRVRFTELSTGVVDSWAWDFDNDGVIDSTKQNPSYTYTDAGRYTVVLTVTGPGGSSECQMQIRVQAAPLEVEEGPNLVPAYLLVSPDTVVPNQEVEISINMGNDGGTTGTRSIALYINGEVDQAQTVSVSPGSSKLLVFRVTRAEPGVYQVMLEGNEGQFTVLDQADARYYPGPLGTPGVIVIVVVAVVLIGAIVFVFMRRT